MIIVRNGRAVLDESLSDLRRAWGEASSAIARARDNPLCADEEAARDFDSDPGLFSRINFNPIAKYRRAFYCGREFVRASPFCASREQTAIAN